MNRADYRLYASRCDDKSLETPRKLAALMARIQRGDVEGNPWTWPEFKACAALLGDLVGKDKYSVDFREIIES